MARIPLLKQSFELDWLLNWANHADFGVSRFTPDRNLGISCAPDQPATMKTELPTHALQIADRLAFFRNHPIFGILGPELLQQLRSHARLKTIERGTTVFAKGDPGTSLFAILEGQVKVISFSAQGKYAVFNVLSAGDIFGEIALLDGGERTADVIAITDCKLLVIERRDFLPLVHSRPDVAQKLIEVLCGRLRNTSRQVEEVMFLDLSAKLARTLLRLGRKARADRRSR